MRLALLLCVAAPGLALADSVVYQGQAGPNRLLVIIALPDAIPGLASIDVQSEEDLQRLQLLALPLRSEEAAYPPVPDEAKRSTSDPRHFSGTLWLMSRGSWQVHLAAYGEKGKGELSVPVPAVALKVKDMPPALGAVLFGLMLVLALGLVSIVAAAVREGALEPGIAADSRMRNRGRMAKGIAAIAVGAGLFLGWKWWGVSAAEATEKLYRPLNLDARVGDGSLSLTLLDPSPEEAKSDDPTRSHRRRFGTVDDLAAPLDLFLVQLPEGARAWHVRPSPSGPGRFTVPLSELPAGRFDAFVSVVHANGFAETLSTEIDLRSGGRKSSVPDGPVSLAPGQTFVAGTTARIELGNGQPLAHPELAQAVVLRSDLSDFVRLRPSGTVPAASEAIANPGTAPSAPPAPASTVAFPYVFPRGGRYRLFVEPDSGTGELVHVDVDVAAGSAG